jgi:hypothetical protein
MNPGPPPLLILPEARIQRELQHAQLAAAQMQTYRRQLRRVIGLCVIEVLVGYGFGVLAFHVHGEELGRAMYLAATLMITGGPAWTLLIWHWLENQS